MNNLLLILLISFYQINSLTFLLEAGKEKCFLDDTPSEVNIVVYYEILDKLEKDVKINAKIYNVENKTLIFNSGLKKTKGKFSFVPHFSGQIKFCYSTNQKKGWVYDSPKIRINLRQAIGVQEVDTSSLVKNKDLSEIQSSARELYKNIKKFAESQMMESEQEDHLFNHLNVLDNRVKAMVWVQCSIILFASIFQIYYLRSFFIAKQIA